MHNDRLSLDNFKKWMREHNDEYKFEYQRRNGLIGLQVESRVTLKKLMSKMSMESGEIEAVAAEFNEQGGKIANADGKTLLVETPSGSFNIHRCYVKKSF